MSRIAAVLVPALLPMVAGAQPTTTPKSECEDLLGALLPFAEKMLKEHGEFFPYGGTMDPSGKIALSAAYDGTERPPSATLIEMLRSEFKEGASKGKYEATALVYDVRVVPPGGVKTDAIAVELDHRDDYTVVVYFPYKLDHNEVTLGRRSHTRVAVKCLQSMAPNNRLQRTVRDKVPASSTQRPGAEPGR